MAVGVKVTVDIIYHVHRVPNGFRHQMGGEAHFYQQRNVAVSYIVNPYSLNPGSFAAVFHGGEKLAS